MGNIQKIILVYAVNKSTLKEEYVMEITQTGANLLYEHSGLKNIDLDKLSTKQVELLEIQNKLYFYRKRTKSIIIKSFYTLAICLIKFITFSEFNNLSS